MKPAAWRLVVTAVLFLGWLGYLAYLVRWTANPIVLSRPQLLVSDFDVIAEVNSTKDPVKVLSVLYPPSEKGQEGKEITVTNLEQCKPPPRADQKAADVPLDFSGPGRYLLPLQRVSPDDQTRFQVVPIPPSPGFAAEPRGPGPPRIYPANPTNDEVIRQYRIIQKP